MEMARARERERESESEREEIEEGETKQCKGGLRDPLDSEIGRGTEDLGNGLQ